MKLRLFNSWVCVCIVSVLIIYAYHNPPKYSLNIPTVSNNIRAIEVYALNRQIEERTLWDKATEEHMIYNPYPVTIEPFKMKASAYCSGKITASGKNIRVGLIAGMPEWIGKTVIIRTDINNAPGDLIGIYELEDTGGPLISKGVRLDIYNPSYEWCIDFGVQEVWVQLIDAEG